MELPKAPPIFTKSSSCLGGTSDSVVLGELRHGPMVPAVSKATVPSEFPICDAQPLTLCPSPGGIRSARRVTSQTDKSDHDKRDGKGHNNSHVENEEGSQ
jgi:hypothetical protein